MPSVSVPFDGSPEPTSDAGTPSPHQPYTMPPVMPGRRSGGEISISTSRDGVQRFEYTSGAGSMPVAQSPQAPSSITFRSPDGFSIMAREARRDSLVVGADGEVISSLGALLNCGMIEERNGSYVMAGEAQEAPEVDQQAHQQVDTPTPDAPVQDLLPDGAEAIVSHLANSYGDAYRSIEAIVVGGKTPSASDIDAAASAMGITHDEASGLVQKVVATFAEQATLAVAGMVGDADAVFAWANSDPQGKALFHQARAMQARDRSLEGYALLSQQYILALADKDPKAVVAGLVAGGGKAHVEAGRVMVDLGNGMGTTPLAAAFKSGLAGFTGKRSRS